MIKPLSAQELRERGIDTSTQEGCVAGLAILKAEWDATQANKEAVYADDRDAEDRYKSFDHQYVFHRCITLSPRGEYCPNNAEPGYIRCEDHGREAMQWSKGEEEDNRFRRTQ